MAKAVHISHSMGCHTQPAQSMEAAMNIRLRNDRGVIHRDLKTAVLILCTLALAAVSQAQALTEEQAIVAKTLLGEARGEGYAGMYAVGCVIAARSIGKKPKDICLKNNGKVWQFSCWNPADPNFKQLHILLKTHPLARKAKLIAVHLHALDRSYVGHADHYAHESVDNYWTRKLKHVGTVGNHKFYRKDK